MLCDFPECRRFANNLLQLGWVVQFHKWSRMVILPKGYKTNLRVIVYSLIEPIMIDPHNTIDKFLNSISGFPQPLHSSLNIWGRYNFHHMRQGVKPRLFPCIIYAVELRLHNLHCNIPGVSDNLERNVPVSIWKGYTVWCCSSWTRQQNSPLNYIHCLIKRK